jgi:hypothetical protein
MMFPDRTAVLFLMSLASLGLASLSLAGIAVAASNDLDGSRQLHAEYVGFDALAYQVFGKNRPAGNGLNGARPATLTTQTGGK